MNEMIYLYDGSFHGFLCCIFESYAKKESPKARETVPFPQSFSYGRRGEAQLRTKFFAPLSFKKAGGRR